ncbi:MAG: hypothetical protein AAFN41_01580 [Planctomycetota bacterium]
MSDATCLHCADCGYPKAGISNGPCPECGCEHTVSDGAAGASAWLWLLPVAALASPAVVWVAAGISIRESADGQAGMVYLSPIGFTFCVWPLALIDVAARSGLIPRLQKSNTVCVLAVVAAVALGALLLSEKWL